MTVRALAARTRRRHAADVSEARHVRRFDSPREVHGAAGPVWSGNIPWERWSRGTLFGSRFRHLTTAAIGPDYHVGVRIEELQPGQQTSPLHWHTREQEHLLVLEGRCTLRLGAERHPLRAGDCAFSPDHLRLSGARRLASAVPR